MMMTTKRIGVSLAVGTIPTLVWWFAELNFAAPFDDAMSRLVWVAVTAYFGICCYAYPGWYD